MAENMSNNNVKKELAMLQSLSTVKPVIQLVNGRTERSRNTTVVSASSFFHSPSSSIASNEITTPTPQLQPTDLHSEEIDANNLTILTPVASPRHRVASLHEDFCIRGSSPFPLPRKKNNSESISPTGQEQCDTASSSPVSSVSTAEIQESSNVSDDEEDTDVIYPVHLRSSRESQEELLHVARELFAIEWRYVRNLQTLVELKTGLERGGYTMHIFKDAECLYNFHQLLLSQMQAILERGEHSFLNIYEPFLGAEVNFLNMYKGSIHSMHQGIAAYSHSRESDTRFLDIVHQHVSGKEDMNLISHVARHITFYPVLLQRFVNLLPDDSEHKCKAEEALNRVTTIVKNANDYLNVISCNLKKCLMILELGNVTTLPDSSAHFLKYGKVQKLSKRTEKCLRSRRLYLFSDMLYLQSRKGCMKKEVKVKDFRDLHDIELSYERNKLYPYRFRLLMETDSIDMVFNTETDMDEWRTLLTQLLPNNENSVSPRSTVSLTNLPWYKDETVSMCMVCFKPFHMFCRKHHCRNCGKIICESCSQYLESGHRETRVCLPCFSVKSPEEYIKLSIKSKRRCSVEKVQQQETRSEFSMRVTYEQFVSQRRTKAAAKFHCFVLPDSKTLAFYSKPRDPQPKHRFECSGMSYRILLCPPMVNRAADSVRILTNCVLILDQSSSTTHLLTLEEPHNQTKFLTLLKETFPLQCESFTDWISENN